MESLNRNNTTGQDSLGGSSNGSSLNGGNGNNLNGSNGNSLNDSHGNNLNSGNGNSFNGGNGNSLNSGNFIGGIGIGTNGNRGSVFQGNNNNGITVSTDNSVTNVYGPQLPPAYQHSGQIIQNQQQHNAQIQQQINLQSPSCNSQSQQDQAQQNQNLPSHSIQPSISTQQQQNDITPDLICRYLELFGMRIDNQQSFLANVIAFKEANQQFRDFVSGLGLSEQVLSILFLNLNTQVLVDTKEFVDVIVECERDQCFEQDEDWEDEEDWVDYVGEDY